MSQANTASSTFASAENAAEIAAKNDRARLSIGREIEELLRIRREADATATRLIDLLDLHEPDPDLEPEEDETGAGRDVDADVEPSLGWTTTVNQTASAFHGPWAWDTDLEGEHDGREPDVDREPDHDDEREDEGVEWTASDPAYYARLRARREGGRATP